MKRRDALKTIGLTAAAIATLDGEKLLAQPQLPDFPKSYPYQQDLGWYGVIRSDKPFNIQQGSDGHENTGYMLSFFDKEVFFPDWIHNEPIPIYQKFVKDETIVEMQQCKLSNTFIFSNQHCTRKYDLLPPPLRTEMLYYGRKKSEWNIVSVPNGMLLALPQPVLIQYWDENIQAKRYNNQLHILCSGQQPAHRGRLFEIEKGLLKPKSFTVDWQSRTTVFAGWQGTRAEAKPNWYSAKTVRIYKDKLVCMITVIGNNWHGNWRAVHQFISSTNQISLLPTHSSHQRPNMARQ